MSTALSSSLLAPLFSSAAMRAIVDDRARLQRMLDFEAALARAEAGAGIIPAKAPESIAAALAGITPALASAFASAASKSSMRCSRARSSVTARIAALENSGPKREGEDWGAMVL